MALNMPWVKMENLTEHDPAKVTRPETPRGEDSSHDPRHPLYAIFGQDPRTTASKEVGDKLVQEIVGRLEKLVNEAVATVNASS